MVETLLSELQALEKDPASAKAAKAAAARVHAAQAAAATSDVGGGGGWLFGRSKGDAAGASAAAAGAGGLFGGGGGAQTSAALYQCRREAKVRPSWNRSSLSSTMALTLSQSPPNQYFVHLCVCVWFLTFPLFP